MSSHGIYFPVLGAIEWMFECWLKAGTSNSWHLCENLLETAGHKCAVQGASNSL